MPLPTCPKCAYQRLPTDRHIHEGVCPACGIAYQKYIARQRGLPVDVPAPLEYEIVPHWSQRWMASPDRVSPLAFNARCAAWCGFTLWGIWFAVHGIDWEIIGGSFLHQVILPFHEFGHILFLPFGRFMAILGGSLFQVMLPLGLGAAFLFRQRDTFGASVMLWWTGQSLVDLSPYVADAVERSLPLVGGAGEQAHDWGNLLTMMDLLAQTRTLAHLCFGAGLLLMLAGLAWGAALLRRQYQCMHHPSGLP